MGSCIRSDSTVHRRELCDSVHQGVMLELFFFFLLTLKFHTFSSMLVLLSGLVPINKNMWNVFRHWLYI